MITKDKSAFVLLQCKHLSLFYFLCGRLGHGESYCLIRLSQGFRDTKFEWDISLRAIPQRENLNVSRWHREAPTSFIKTSLEIEKARRGRRMNDQNGRGQVKERDPGRRFHRLAQSNRGLWS